MDESITGPAVELDQVGEVAGIRELVEHGDLDVRPRAAEVAYEIRADHVPTVRLLLMDMPGLRDAGVHQRVTPLPKVLEELVSLANHLAEEASLILMSGELFQDDALDAHDSRFAMWDRTKSLTA